MYGVPSQCQADRYYLVSCGTRDCPDFQRHGLSGMRIGHAGSHTRCKHLLTVRLHCELVKAQERRKRRQTRRLTVVSTGDVFDRFQGA